MKAGKVALLFILCTSILQGKEIDPTEGLRGLTWGEKIPYANFRNNENPEFTITENLGKINLAQLINDDYTIGTVTLNEIIYFFHDDAGFFKYMLVGNAENSDDMDAILKNRLGKDYEYTVQSTETYKVWTLGDVRMEFRKQKSKDFYVTITSADLAQWQISMNKTINDF
jgi:hypothetical protein